MPGWARWDRWSRSSRWGGGVVFYTISGQINDASGSGLDGVTVTLTGTASDSVVTAGGGLYEFQGLLPGSYTLTPTKAGYTFDPTSAAVTIVGTNKVATTMAAVWKIAGTILDGTDPIASATVTLTGDASDSTTTDGSGNYEFTTLSDGSYTVTPTKTAHTFTPTSSAETVAGADVDSDFVGTEWLIYDEFTTADAAPITSPRTCEPGPGTLTVTDLTEVLSLSGGSVVKSAVSAWAGIAETDGDLGTEDSLINGGFCVMSEWVSATSNYLYLGMYNTASAASTIPPREYIESNSTGIGWVNIYEDAAATKVSINHACSYPFTTLMVKRSNANGIHYVAGSKLIWVSKNGAAWVAFDRPGLTFWNGEYLANTLGALSLPANGYTEWGADFSTVTDTKTNPAPATTYDCDADFHITWTWTHEVGKSASQRVRYTDTSNYIGVQDFNNTFSLFKKTGGGFASLWTGTAMTDAVEYKADLVCEGSSIKLYLDNVLKASITETDHQTVTGGTVIHDLATNDIVLSTHPYPSLGAATSRVIAPQTSDTGTMTADALVYVRTIAVPAAGNFQLELRKSGADELTLDVDSTGALLLQENGVTRISGGAATVASDDDIAVILDDVDVEVFVNGTSVGSYGSLTLTAGITWNVLDDGDGADSIEFWPRSVSSILAPELT